MPCSRLSLAKVMTQANDNDISADQVGRRPGQQSPDIGRQAGPAAPGRTGRAGADGAVALRHPVRRLGEPGEARRDEPRGTGRARKGPAALHDARYRRAGGVSPRHAGGPSVGQAAGGAHGDAGGPGPGDQVTASQGRVAGEAPGRADPAGAGHAAGRRADPREAQPVLTGAGTTGPGTTGPGLTGPGTTGPGTTGPGTIGPGTTGAGTTGAGTGGAGTGAQPSRRGLSRLRTFHSLGTRNYRLFAAGQVVSNSGTWMQRVAQDWLVLELTHGSGTALGIATGLQFLPLLLFSLWGGAIADRYSKRRILMITQTFMGVLALILGVLAVTGAVRIWQVYALAFALGLATVVDNPTRQTFVVEMVGPADLPNAIALNSAIFNLARIAGPALAGLVIGAVGTPAAFFVNAASFGAVLTGLKLMRPGELNPVVPVPRSKGQLREALRYVKDRPSLSMPMVLIFFVATFGMNFQVTNALMSRQLFHTGATAFGLASAVFAAGGRSEE